MTWRLWGEAEEDALAAEAAELAGVVIDEEVCAEDALVSAEDDVRRER